VGAPGLPPKPWEACSGKLLSWQGVVVEFAAAAGAEVPGYADVVHPLQLACFQMGAGAQLLAAGLEAEAAGHSVVPRVSLQALECHTPSGPYPSSVEGVNGDALG